VVLPKKIPKLVAIKLHAVLCVNVILVAVTLEEKPNIIVAQAKTHTLLNI